MEEEYYENAVATHEEEYEEDGGDEESDDVIYENKEHHPAPFVLLPKHNAVVTTTPENSETNVSSISTFKLSTGVNVITTKDPSSSSSSVSSYSTVNTTNMADLKASHLPMVPEFTCLLIRGLPGSGKTRFAAAYGQRYAQIYNSTSSSSPGVEVIESQHPDKHANMTKDEIRQHYISLQHNAETIMAQRSAGLLCIVGTFCKIWEMEPYIKAAVNQKYNVAICGLFDAGGVSSEVLSKRSSSRTPSFVIESMRGRYRKIPMYYMGLLDERQIRELLLLDSTISKKR